MKNDRVSKDQTIRKNDETRNLVTAAFLLSIAIVVQFVGRFNPEFSRIFVGPVINAIILLAVYFSSPKFGFIVAFSTPLLAYFTGQLNPAFLPIVPFIIIANLIYALTFALYRKNTVERIVSGIIGSLLKFGFLLFSIKVLVPLLGIDLGEKLNARLSIAFGTIQLITALIGVAVAVVLIDILNRVLKKERYSMKI